MIQLKDMNLKKNLRSIFSLADAIKFPRKNKISKDAFSAECVREVA
jgi:hypothetical protein